MRRRHNVVEFQTATIFVRFLFLNEKKQLSYKTCPKNGDIKSKRKKTFLISNLIAISLNEASNRLNLKKAFLISIALEGVYLPFWAAFPSKSKLNRNFMETRLVTD